ncbi:glycosyl hydrolase family 28-related protein [Paenibacillus sp. GCM10012307]|uniref:Rhamnogalacturonase A/B/Epimerase-like pectate lyase domain-containing protein n=1 Tax=Paenibacillus roseus TaxID=2798579 RepID=A0A934MNP2_9BACL|nr:glycosyl hydrolase family 28-related protein [Paenibacillus roseus]MBJ6361226.1 hypothetical protein [Paenibacillus roseus]
MKKKWLSKLLAILPVFALITSIVVPVNTAAGAPWRSSLYPANWTPSYTDGQGRFLQDFSYAGYWRGEKDIPTNPPGATYNVVTQYGADPNGGADSTNAIQNAINAAGNAGGGIVYLPPGTYKVKPQGSSNSAIWINRNNVVLRGAGKSSTFIFNDSTSMRDKAVIRVAPINSADWFSPTNTPTSIRSDIQPRSTRIPVNSVSGYNLNEFVIVRADASDAFIAEHRMSGLWNSSLRGQTFSRQIVGIEAATNTLIVDIPIRYTLKTRDNARVYKVGIAITEAGIENLSIGMRQHTGSGWGDTDFNRSGTGAYDVHASKAVTFSNARNSWMDNVNSYRPSSNGSDIHLLSHGVVINQSRSITIQNTNLQKPQYRGEGGNGYLYHVQGGDNLIQNSVATNARHSFTMSSMWTNGNVFFRNTSNYPRLASDFHMHLSVANLFDSMTMNGDYLEAVYRPYGTVQHGWTTSQSVFWNTTGNAYQSGQSSIVKSRQWGQGYVIGTRGAANNVEYSISGNDASAPQDFVEGIGTAADLQPQSLYLDQKAKRLGGGGNPNPDPGNLLTNPGFEDGSLNGWIGWDNGTLAQKVDTDFPLGGSYKLTHWASVAYQQLTYQQVSVPNGLYSASVWVRSGGGQKVLRLFARNYGAAELTAEIGSSPITGYTKYTIDNINVTNGQVEIGIWNDANANNWAAFDNFELVKK